MTNSKLAYELKKEARELEALVQADPDHYFAQSWLEAAAQLRKEADAKHQEEQAALVGKTYNTFTDQWEEQPSLEADMTKLYYIEFKSADGKFFTSRHARYGSIADLVFDLQPYFKRFPEHSASWTVLDQENLPGELARNQEGK